jgi:hypothetical protein
LAKTWKVRREIKKNIIGLTETRHDVAGMIGRFLIRVAAALIAIMIPLCVVLFAANVVFRVPDLYSFEFDRSEIAKEIQLEADSKQISTVISDYMMHKTDKFSLLAEYKGRDSSVFTIIDASRMHMMRSLLDKTFYLMCFMFVLTLIFFLLILVFGRKRHLRYSFRASIAVYLLSLGGLVYFATADEPRHWVMEDLLQITFTAEDVLPQLFDKFFLTEVSLAIAAISLIIYVILYSIARRFYKENNMFA